MKPHRMLFCLWSVALLIAVGLTNAETLELKARPGSKVRIDGTSTVHDWTVEGNLIGGSATVGAGFPLEAAQAVTPGPVAATVNAFIPITSLKSVKDGKPYSTKMDEIMYEKLGKPTHRNIAYSLDELILKSAPEANGAPFLFEAKGKLVVAGVTNLIQLPVEVTPMGEGQVKFATKTSLKMTDYKIEPPAPTIALGLIKTGDEVQLQVEWMTGKPVGK
ncbi:MAG: YceI family protein [Verrucomicrobia bacterium]|nr:YceI family protein [Verrucomicrobiota bacterium]